MREIYNNKKLIFLALLIAILLWFYVNNNQNESFPGLVQNQQKSLILTVEKENVPQGYRAVLSEEEVIIFINNSIYNNYEKNDFRAFVNLEEIKPGSEKKILVQLDKPRSAEVIDVRPRYIRVTLSSYKE